jgi:pimeloyl-CoA synthetase
LISDFDDKNFPVIVANCISPFGSHQYSTGWFNSKVVTYQPIATIKKKQFNVSGTVADVGPLQND